MMTEHINPEEFFRSVDDSVNDKPNGAAGGGVHRFWPLRFKDIALSTDCPYLVKGLIPREGLTIVWGPPKCGKSYWTFDVAMHVTLGWNYRGRKVTQGTVVYIACEGERGLAARAEAFRQKRLAGGDDPPFFLVTTRLDLVADVEQLVVDIQAAIGADHCAAIVVDTLNRSIAGSESRDDDMGAYIKAADRLREAFAAAIIIIHHCGINEARPRGHTSLTGAADAQIAIKRDDGDRIIAMVEHMKDGAEGDVIASRLAVVEIGLDEDRDILTSCVIEPAEAPTVTKAKAGKGLTTAARVALNTLRKAVAEAGEPPPASNHIPTQARVVPVKTWRDYHYTGTALDGQSTETRKKDFQRVRTQLQAAGEIGLHAELCWVVADG